MKLTPLKDVAEIHYGEGLKSDLREDSYPYPVYGANGVVGRYKEYIVDHESVVIGRKGSCGEVTLAHPNFWPIDTAFYTKIKEDFKLDNRYLYYALRAVDLKKLIITTSIPGINRDALYNVKIPLPDKSTQERIVILLRKAESALEKRRQTLRLADEFLKSAFLEIFGDPDKKGFRRKIDTLGDVDIAIIDGDRGTNYPKQNEFSEEGYCLFLNTKNVTKRGFSFESRMFVSQEKDMRLRKGKLERNDLILTTRGTVGNIAVYDDSIPFENVRINSGMVILRPNLKTFKLSFLEHLFRSEYIKNQILTISSGCAQPQLPISSLKQLKISVPSLLEQQKFADLVKKVEELKEKQKQSETQLQNLFNSLVQRAFKGELFKE